MGLATEAAVHVQRVGVPAGPFRRQWRPAKQITDKATGLGGLLGFGGRL